MRPNLNMTTSVISSTVQEPRHATKAVRMSPFTAARAAWTSNSFHEFMAYMRAHQGDILEVDLWPVLPPIYLVMGKAANRAVLSDLDSALEQVLQDLINVLPVSAKIPSEVDVELQRKVASFFQKESTVNGQLPRFISAARTMREGWLAKPDSSAPLDVFFELSEYVLLTDLEVLYGKSFCDKYGARVIPGFRQWVENIANGELVGFFAELGDCLREAIAEQLAHPERYADERSVMRVYLEDGALDGRHDVDEVVGLLTMTLMAAVFNTQVSLAWILVHLYEQPELLAAARHELEGCSDLANYSQLQRMEFVNSCIDESVRLHTMLPGNTVLRKTLSDVRLLDVDIPADSLLWLYPNAVHQDEQYFEDAPSFCPMRLIGEGKIKRMGEEFELVTFGLGQKRCIGEKMARAMICAFLGESLPYMDARGPEKLPLDNNLFDLIPASKLQLRDLRPRNPSVTGLS